VTRQWQGLPNGPRAASPILPEGHSEEKFEQALEVLKGTIGKEGVISGDEHLKRYGDPFRPFETGSQIWAAVPSRLFSSQWNKSKEL